VDTGVVVNPRIVLGRCPAWDVAVRYRYNDPKHISVHPSLRNRTARCSRWIRRRHGSAGAWRRRRAATHDIGLVDPPAVSHGAPAGTGGVGQQWREPLHPAVDGDMVDLDAALSQEFLDVAIRQPEAQYQRTASTMMSGGSRSRRRQTARQDQGQVEFSCQQSCRSGALTANAAVPNKHSAQRHDNFHTVSAFGDLNGFVANGRHRRHRDGPATLEGRRGRRGRGGGRRG
jgi:hypothetical protein